MAELKELIARRGIYKSQLTKFCSFVEGITTTDVGKINELRVRLAKLEPVYTSFSDIQMQIELKDESGEQAGERDSFENKYFAVVAKSDELLAVFSNTNSATPSVPLQETNTRVESRINLPKIALPEFAGSYDKWQTFYDTFRSLIDSDDSLTDVQKFHYLQACLKGEAQIAIQAIEITEANYRLAFNLLKERYENRKVIIRSYLKNIYDLPYVTKNSHASLSDFLDNLQRNVRSLKALGLPVDQWDAILLYQIIQKLDTDSRREWEVSTKNTDLPTYNSFIKFLTDRSLLLESLDAKIPCRKNDVRVQYHNTVNQIKCPVCREAHYIYTCPKFLNFDKNRRYAAVKRANLCTNCLRAGHSQMQCSAGGCKTCYKKHSSLLHFEKNRPSNNNHETRKSGTDDNSENRNPREDGSASTSSATSTNCSQLTKNYVLLSTAEILVLNVHGEPVKCRALLDNGSQSNFMTNALYKKLELPSERVNMPVIGFSASLTNITRATKATIKSRYNNFTSNLSFLITEKITESVPQFNFNSSLLNIPENIKHKLADTAYYQSGVIDVLLGASVFYNLLSVGQLKLGDNLPVLQKSTLGWIISGPLNLDKYFSTFCNLNMEVQLLKQVEKFWSLEHIVPKKVLSREEEKCEKHFIDNFQRDKLTGRFSVALPFRENCKQLGDSRDMAIKRFYSLERKLEKNEELKAQYGAFLTEYSELGHMSPVDANLQTQGEYYLPHHAVENCNSTTTKLRVVFDASAKTTNNLSLNDVLMTGPVIQEELFSILLRARKHNVVITADVSKMYRQIEIKSGQRNFQRIVWRNSPDQPLSHFNLNTVTYGTAPASFLATRCIYQIALEHREKFPVASEIVMSDFYVDDLITGAPDIASATILIRDIIQILSSGCFPLRKWNSNKPGVIYSSLTDTANSEENFLINDSKNSKTLGVMWNRDLDIFKYVSGINGNKMVPSTKRQILSVISQIFDPLGLVGPVTIRSKVILQKLWSLKMDWDESIPQDLFTSWCKIYENLSSLEKIQIPRQIVLTNFVLLEIHAFSDASQIGYGACVYARSQASDGRVAVRLITAKSRVAPLKAQTIPRLELCAAQLLSQLVVKTISALKMTVNRVYCWTDSSIVLAWLSTESSTLKTFVSHRVAEIQTNTCGFQWRYVPTDQNPADIISRGLEPSQLASSSLWWEGPTFLSCTENSWPPNIYTKPQGLLEVKNNVISLISTVPRPEIFHRFSDFRKLVHVTAYSMRFVNNASPKRPKLAGNLSVSEVTNAKIMLLKLVQISEFAQELHALKRGKNIALSSKLKCLDPFLDESGLIRVWGRLKNADLEVDHKHPIVLPGNHLFTTLVIRYEHVKNFHAGH